MRRIAVPPGMAAEGKLASPMGVTIPKGYRNGELVATSWPDDTDEIRVILGNNIARKAFRAWLGGSSSW